jgi:FkbM family methyltransferase
MIISYAQNYEDVILWRALGHIQNGFYFDIGAWSPTVDSVTKTFYDSGWCGINVEPEKEMYGQLVKERPRDINLKLAASDSESISKMFFNVKDSALSTMVEGVSLNNQNSFGLDSYEEFVPTMTLEQIWNDHVPAGQDVHFLKIDVEGFEKKVIAGNDWQTKRPWVLVIESNIPMSRKPSQKEWEHVLLENNYVFVYGDGMNRFYLAKERLDLMRHFEFPIGIFDNFITIHNLEILERLNEVESKICNNCTNLLNKNWMSDYPERNYTIES